MLLLLLSSYFDDWCRQPPEEWPKDQEDEISSAAESTRHLIDAGVDVIFTEMIKDRAHKLQNRYNPFKRCSKILIFLSML